METPFFQGITWKRQEAMGTNHSWGHSNWTQEEKFSREQSAIGTILQGKVLNFQTLGTSKIWHKGCWVTLSRLCFFQGRLDQVILEVLSTLVLWDSVNWDIQLAAGCLQLRINEDLLPPICCFSHRLIKNKNSKIKPTCRIGVDMQTLQHNIFF